MKMEAVGCMIVGSGAYGWFWDISFIRWFEDGDMVAFCVGYSIEGRE